MTTSGREPLGHGGKPRIVEIIGRARVDGILAPLRASHWRRAPRTRSDGVDWVLDRKLGAGPAVLAEARQFVREAALGWSLGERAGDALLVVAGELLANAVLHASGPYEISLKASRSVVRVGVRDGSSSLPVSKRLGGVLAPTGRGLRLVEATAEQWGVEAAGDGKIVWADVRCGIGGGRLHPPSRPRPRLRRHPRRPGQGAGGTVEANPVMLLGVPTDLFEALCSRLDALARECQLMVIGGVRAEVPQELQDLAHFAVQRARDIDLAAAISAATPIAAAGACSDYVITLPYSGATQLEAVALSLEALNGWSRSERLLAPPLTDEMLRLHRFVVDESVAQILGHRTPHRFDPTL
jgi:anti-sigma regulatory factor (Ser/Thr protein kinase)